jgi:tripartite-type tricarboxylate transporter receptor subunit TctC
MSRSLAARLAVIALVAWSGSVAAQTYPARPITIVVPLSAGAATDVMARMMARSMSQKLGQNIVVDNKPGASGNIGTGNVVHATPDGYTVLMTTVNLSMAPIVSKDLDWDPVKDLAPVALLADTPLLLAVKKDLPVNSVAELVAYTKQRPGQLNYATPGRASIHHFAMELFRERTGLDIVHVPYSGVAGALADLSAGRIEMGFSSPGNLKPFIDGDQVKILATSGETRLATLPDVPTLREVGYGDAGVTAWIGMFAPAKTPPAIVQRLTAEALAAMKQPEVLEGIGRLGIVPTPADGAQMGAQLKREVPQWRRIAVAAKIVAE